MREFKAETFAGFIDRGHLLEVRQVIFEDCAFVNCALSLTTD
jgi:hypothetical protein